MPAEIQERFVRVGRTYYFPSGQEAFRDKGSELTTASENAELVRLLVSVGQHRGFDAIRVVGSERFKLQAWRAGFLAGLEVRGYKPSEFENARMVRALARQNAHSLDSNSATRLDQPSEERTAPKAHQEVIDVDRSRKPSDTKRAAAGEKEKKTEGLYLGQLLAHGAAPYPDHPDDEPSYFIKIQTEQGERTLWGKDLERALKESVTRPQVGDRIGVRATGRNPVTVSRKQHDAAGQLVGVQRLDTHRNSWVVEKAEHFEARQSAAAMFRDETHDPQSAVKEHPELVGSYLSLHAAEQLAQQHIADKSNRRAFLNAVREKLAREIAQGAGVPRVKLRESARTQDQLVTALRERETARVPG